MGRQYNADSSPRHMLRTLVVDDHDAVRKAICQLLRSQSDFEVVCEVADGFEVRRTEELSKLFRVVILLAALLLLLMAIFVFLRIMDLMLML